jgi:hypothetical protein
MRLPISKESAFIIGVGLVGIPLYQIFQAKMAQAREAQARAQRNHHRGW